MEPKNNGDGTYTVTYEWFDQVQGELALLAALEAAGVDNWEGYDNAHRILEGEEVY